MPSPSVSSPEMNSHSSHMSGRQSSMTKLPRFSQPGPLTLGQILEAPSRPLRWLSQATLSKLRPLLQASSSSHRNARSNLPSQQATPPRLDTVGDTDTHISHAPPPTRHPRFVQFIILGQLTGVRIQHAPGAGTISQSHHVVRPRPPIAATAVMPILPPSKSVRLDRDLLSPPDLPPQNHRVKTPWWWPSMETNKPLLPRGERVQVRCTSQHSDNHLRQALRVPVPLKALAVLFPCRNQACLLPPQLVGYVPEWSYSPPQPSRRHASLLSLLSIIHHNCLAS